MGPRRSGFSLIEALVALTIAAMVLGAVFELQVQMVRGQQRATAAIAQVMAQESAIALTRNVNPMEQPSGRIALPDGDTITWTSEPYGVPRVNAGFPEDDGSFEVQLFAVTVAVAAANGPSPQPLTFDRMGWRRLDQPAA